jgi:hypothetical protein
MKIVAKRPQERMQHENENKKNKKLTLKQLIVGTFINTKELII